MTPSTSPLPKPRSQPSSWSWGGLSVMDRYIVQELVPPFLFGVGAFTSVLWVAGSLFDLVRRVTDMDLPIQTAIEVSLLNLPYFLVLSFPMSALLATMIAYGRLSGDSELVALRSCGVSVYRFVAPALVLCLIVTGFTFILNEQIVPAANYRAATTLERSLGEERPPFQEKDILYQEYGEVEQPEGGVDNELVRIFYARRFNGKRMKGLTILDFSRRAQGLNQILTADAAMWNPQENTWDFSDGTIYIVAPDGSYRNIVKFDQQQLRLPRTPLDLASRTKDYGEMNIAQSRERLTLLKQGGDDRKIRKLEVRIQQKFSTPFACLVFGLVGAALGIRPQRTSRSTSFGFSVLIIFGYYSLAVLIGDPLAQGNILSPMIGAWLPNVIGLGVGTFLLVRSAR